METSFLDCFTSGTLNPKDGRIPWWKPFFWVPWGISKDIELTPEYNLHEKIYQSLSCTSTTTPTPPHLGSITATRIIMKGGATLIHKGPCWGSYRHAPLDAIEIIRNGKGKHVKFYLCDITPHTLTCHDISLVAYKIIYIYIYIIVGHYIGFHMVCSTATTCFLHDIALEPEPYPSTPEWLKFVHSEHH